MLGNSPSQTCIVFVEEMSDSDGDMDMYPDNDVEFAGENLVSKLSPTRSTTKVSTPLDDRKSESDASKAFSEGKRFFVSL